MNNTFSNTSSLLRTLIESLLYFSCYIVFSDEDISVHIKVQTFKVKFSTQHKINIKPNPDTAQC